MIYLFSFFAYLLTYYSIVELIPIFSTKLIDKPNSRSSHLISTPKGGGISFVLIGTIFCFLLKVYYLLYLLPLSIIGFLDDKYNLPRYLRYIFQYLTSLVLVITSNSFPHITNNLNYPLSILFIFLLAFVGTAIINFLNFMDGLDGLVIGSMCVIIFTYICLVNISILPMFFSLLAFLYWNWSPAKIFMGDVGSTFLGALLFSMIMRSNSFEISLGLFFISTPLLIDPLITLIRRFLDKQSIFNPHRLHLYQRLHQAGWSHSSVSSIYIALTTLNAFLFSFLGAISIIYMTLLTSCFGFALDKYYAKPFKGIY